MSVYKLYGSGAGGAENAISSLDIQFDGEIVAMHAAMQADLDADQEYAQAEASFLSTHTFSANDARGSLMEIREWLALTTSGGANTGINTAMSGLRIPVTRGERIYLHIQASAGVASTVTIYIYVNDHSDPRLRRRR